MVRVTAPVAEETLQFVLSHPSDLGLPDDASQASVIARVIEIGAKELRRRLREQERDRLYRDWADDPEREEASTFHEQAARETGMY
jgi:hypothetical protein